MFNKLFIFWYLFVNIKKLGEFNLNKLFIYPPYIYLVHYELHLY